MGIVRVRSALFLLCIVFSILVFGLSASLAPYYSDRAKGFANVLDLIKQLPSLTAGIPSPATRDLINLRPEARISPTPDAASSTTKEDIEYYHSQALGAMVASIILAIGSAVGFLWSIAAIVLTFRKNEVWLSVRRAGSLSIVAWLFHLIGAAVYSSKIPYDTTCARVTTDSEKEKCMVHNALTVTMWLSFLLWTALVVVLFLGRGIFGNAADQGRSRAASSSGKVRYPFDATVDNVQTSSDMEMASQPKHGAHADPFSVPGSTQRELEVDESPFADPK